jgi:hypothetical protein
LHRRSRVDGRAGLGDAQRGELPLPRIVDGLSQQLGCFLRRMKAHAIFGGDEVEPPLRAALQP